MKKKLLAGLLSFTVLTAQMLPVIAADDADVVVSENAVVVEETEEEAESVSEDVAEDTTDIVFEVGEEVSIDAFSDCVLLNEEVVSEENGEAVVESEYLLNSINTDIVVDGSDLVDAMAVPGYIYEDDKRTEVISPDLFNDGTREVNLNTSVSYFHEINYRGNKIKPVDQLGATVVSSGLYDYAKVLMTTGTFNSDVIKWTMTPKKNKVASADAYFTVKASVKGKIAKQMGIKGKDLKNLKKAVKLFNKTAKTRHLMFVIEPIFFDAMMSSPDDYMAMTIHILTRYIGGMPISSEITGISIRCLTRPEQVDQYAKRFKKWTKPSKADVTVKKQADKSYTITANCKNYYSYGIYKVSLVKKNGKYYYDLVFQKTR